jgi:thymidylate synthase (FAD)
MHNITWKKFRPLTDKNAYICLVDSMGDDSSIVQAARVSYGKDKQEDIINRERGIEMKSSGNGDIPDQMCLEAAKQKDRNLIRYLLNHGHTTPFEMVEIKFMVQVPMDCWRQWIRHRTASVNEYSTRYTEALDFFQVTDPSEWRLQATDNKQGSSGFLENWPEDITVNVTKKGFNVIWRMDHRTISWDLPFDWWEELGYMKSPNEWGNEPTPGQFLTWMEKKSQIDTADEYKLRLAFGIAKEQARKDLPLSTYTRAYWKCDLHNIFNFLRLRMDSHAQLEIRQFANSMYEIVKHICPVACEAFEDYVPHAKKFSRMEMEVLKQLYKDAMPIGMDKPSSMSDREWKEFLGKLS